MKNQCLAVGCIRWDPKTYRFFNNFADFKLRQGSRDGEAVVVTTRKDKKSGSNPDAVLWTCKKGNKKKKQFLQATLKAYPDVAKDMVFSTQTFWDLQTNIAVPRRTFWEPISSFLLLFVRFCPDSVF